MNSSGLLLLADGRFPSGGHAHSGGVEEAVSAGRVGDLTSLASFLEGRLWTAGLVTAALAAAAIGGAHSWSALDTAADARTSSPVLRATSRRQGRQLLRAAGATWGDRSIALTTLGAASPPEGPHYAVALGAAAADAGLSSDETAVVAAYGSVAGPASATVRLLGLDPMAVSSVLGRLASQIDAVAEAATKAAAGATIDGLDRLPSDTAPLLDIGAERHASREARLFAS